MHEHKERAMQVATKNELDEQRDKWWGAQNIYLTKDDIDHLINGGFLFFADGEYSHGIIYEENENGK